MRVFQKAKTFQDAGLRIPMRGYEDLAIPENAEDLWRYESPCGVMRRIDDLRAIPSVMLRIPMRGYEFFSKSIANISLRGYESPCGVMRA